MGRGVLESRSYVARAVGKSSAKSAVSRTVDGVSRREAVALRGDQAARRGAVGRAMSARSSEHGRGINREGGASTRKQPL